MKKPTTKPRRKHTPYNPNACPICKPARCETARRLKPKSIKLTPSQLIALDHLVGMGGEAYAGNGMFREATALPLLRAKCIEVIPGDVSVLFRKYRITEHGRGERAKAHEKAT